MEKIEQNRLKESKNCYVRKRLLSCSLHISSDSTACPAPGRGPRVKEVATRGDGPKAFTPAFYESRSVLRPSNILFFSCTSILPHCAFFIFFIVVQFQFSPFSPHYFPLPYPPPPPTFNPLCCCLRPWVIYTSSLTSPFPFSPPLSFSSLLSGHSQFVLYFHVSGSILLAC